MGWHGYGPWLGAYLATSSWVQFIIPRYIRLLGKGKEYMVGGMAWYGPWLGAYPATSSWVQFIIPRYIELLDKGTLDYVPMEMSCVFRLACNY